MITHRLGIRGHQSAAEEAADEAALRATLSAALRFLHEIQLTRRPREPTPTTAPSSLDDKEGGLTDAPLLSPLLSPLLPTTSAPLLKSSAPTLSAETLAAFEEADAGAVEAARDAKREAVESFVRRDDLRAYRPFELRSAWPPTDEQRRVVECLATSLAAPKVGPLIATECH